MKVCYGHQIVLDNIILETPVHSYPDNGACRAGDI